MRHNFEKYCKDYENIENIINHSGISRETWIMFLD